MKCVIRKDTSWLYPDMPCQNLDEAEAALLCARNSSAAVQFMAGIKEPLCWAWENKPFDGIRTEVYRLLPVHVDRNTGADGYTAEPGEGLGHVCRHAPFDVFDAMKPWNPGQPVLPAEGVCAAYVAFRVGALCKPGVYEHWLRFTSAGDSCRLRLRLCVSGASVPVERTLRLSNWMNIRNIADRHGLELWSEPFWAMLEKYLLLMRHASQTHILLPLSAVGFHRLSWGTIFDFQNAERLISLCLKMGFERIEGAPPVYQKYLGDARFVLGIDPSCQAASREGMNFLRDYFQQLFRFLRRKGWTDRYIQHVADEPFDASREEYLLLASYARQWMPGIPLIDAVCAAIDEPDIIVEDCRRYEERLEDYRRLASRKEIWIYTCSLPGGFYCNRLLDCDLLKTRLLHWGNAFYGLKGYLHWGLNGYRPGQDPYRQCSPRFGAVREEKYLPPGDTHILYPGSDGPYGSVRLEQMRAGTEDYELLTTLKRRGYPTDSIIEKCFRSFQDVGGEEEFLSAYRRLLSASE